jgi:hypothetical protein
MFRLFGALKEFLMGEWGKENWLMPAGTVFNGALGDICFKRH